MNIENVKWNVAENLVALWHVPHNRAIACDSRHSGFVAFCGTSYADSAHFSAVTGRNAFFECHKGLWHFAGPSCGARPGLTPSGEKSQKISCIADAFCRIMSRLFGAARFLGKPRRDFSVKWSSCRGIGYTKGLATRADIGVHGNDSPWPLPRSGLRLFFWPDRAADAPGLHDV